MPSTCYYAGVRERRKTTNQICSGLLAGSGCSAGERCCVAYTRPTSGGQKKSYGSCAYANPWGTCLNTYTASCSGVYRSGLCPGGNTIKCCLR